MLNKIGKSALFSRRDGAVVQSFLSNILFSYFQSIKILVGVANKIEKG